MHQKPCGLLDVDGYFSALLAFLDHMVAERFLQPDHRAVLQVHSDPAQLLEALRTYRPIAAAKWIDRGET